MFFLAFMGDTIDLHLDEHTTAALDWQKTFGIIAFLALYFVFILVTTVLLLNLLIAMMGSTYSEILDAATLQWRFNFARHVALLELVAERWPYCGHWPFDDLFLGSADPADPTHFMPGDKIALSTDGTHVIQEQSGVEVPLLSRQLASEVGTGSGRARNSWMLKQATVLPTSACNSQVSFVMDDVDWKEHSRIIEVRVNTERGEEVLRFRNVARRYCEMTYVSWRDEDGNELLSQTTEPLFDEEIFKRREEMQHSTLATRAPLSRSVTTPSAIVSSTTM